MSDPTPGPMRDPAALARIMHDAAHDAFAASIDEEMTHLGGAITVGRFPWERVGLDVQRRMAAEAEAVAIAVCPPGYRVVPAAAHDALLRLIPDLLSAVETSGDEFATDGFILGTIDDIAAAYHAYVAALGEAGGTDA